MRKVRNSSLVPLTLGLLLLAGWDLLLLLLLAATLLLPLRLVMVVMVVAAALACLWAALDSTASPSTTLTVLVLDAPAGALLATVDIVWDACAVVLLVLLLARLLSCTNCCCSCKEPTVWELFAAGA
jgi:hypothetical protein